MSKKAHGTRSARRRGRRRWLHGPRAVALRGRPRRQRRPRLRGLPHDRRRRRERDAQGHAGVQYVVDYMAPTWLLVLPNEPKDSGFMVLPYHTYSVLVFYCDAVAAADARPKRSSGRRIQRQRQRPVRQSYGQKNGCGCKSTGWLLAILNGILTQDFDIHKSLGSM